MIVRSAQMPLVNALTVAGNLTSVHMGVVLIATLAFGLITPPYGLALLMASKFVGVRFSKALRAALPIHVVFFGTIAFAIYFPKVVLWLPKQVIPESVGCFKNPSGVGYIYPPWERRGRQTEVLFRKLARMVAPTPGHEKWSRQ